MGRSSLPSQGIVISQSTIAQHCAPVEVSVNLITILRDGPPCMRPCDMTPLRVMFTLSHLRCKRCLCLRHSRAVTDSYLRGNP